MGYQNSHMNDSGNFEISMFFFTFYDLVTGNKMEIQYFIESCVNLLHNPVMKITKTGVLQHMLKNIIDHQRGPPQGQITSSL